MDRAVLDAYGWTDLPTDCQFLLDCEEYDDNETTGKKRQKKKPWRYRWPDDIRDEVLARLLALNAERHQEEVRLGIAPGMNGAKKKTAAKKKSAKSQRGKAEDELISPTMDSPEHPQRAHNPEPPPGLPGEPARAAVGALGSLPLRGFDLGYGRSDALPSAEAALQSHRAEAEFLGEEGHGRLGFEQAESHDRGGAQGLPFSQIPLHPEEIRGLSRLGVADRAGRTALRRRAEAGGHVVDEAGFQRNWIDLGRLGDAECQTFPGQEACRFFRPLGDLHISILLSIHPKQLQ
jgi:hypothetical protein